MKYVLAGSGHIAGVVNPPGKPKYQYWTGDAPVGNLDKWIEKATEHPGSWWPDWLEWIRQQDGATVAGARAGRRQVPADRGRAGQLCEGEGLDSSSISSEGRTHEAHREPVRALLASARWLSPRTSPQFQVDPFWPKPLPNNWILGQVAGIATDKYDRIWVVQRPPR